MRSTAAFVAALLGSLCASALGSLVTSDLAGARRLAESHLREVAATELEWAGARLAAKEPSVLNTPVLGDSVPHSAEFDVLASDGSPAGSIHVAATAQSGGELYVPFFRTRGASVASGLADAAREQSGRSADVLLVVNEGTFAAETAEGLPAAWPDKLYTEVPADEGNDNSDSDLWKSPAHHWGRFKAHVAHRRRSHLERNLGEGSFLANGAHYGKASAGDANKNLAVTNKVWVQEQTSDRDLPDFGQISANSAPNTKDCSSGCGPTAIAELMQWHYVIGQRGGKWAQCFPRGSLPSGNAWSSWNSGTKTMIWRLHAIVDTWCVNSVPLMPSSNKNGATYPSDMKKADSYIRGFGGSARFKTDYSSVGISYTSTMDKCETAVKNGGPCVYGLGWLEHYVIIKGFGKYSGNRYAYIENGWSDSGGNNGWVIAQKTWFAGWIEC